MNKIAPDHLTRSAFVYVRQSTPDQLTKIPKVAVGNTPSQLAPRPWAGKE